MSRVFLLSPANPGGARGRMVLNPQAQFELAVNLRSEGAPLGDVYSFISGLYFRGKTTYAKTFAAPPAGAHGSYVITAGRGLVTPDTLIAGPDLEAIASVPIDASDRRYRDPLERDAKLLYSALPDDCAVVLLGSIASSKYVEPLLEVFGERLLFPEEFVGRGDMSRGGLMLRCSRDGVELKYIPALNAVRTGRRPPKLTP